MKKQNEKQKINKEFKNKYYNIQTNFVIHFNSKKIISKMYLRNNIKETDFQFRIKPNYRKKEIIIKFRKIKK